MGDSSDRAILSLVVSCSDVFPIRSCRACFGWGAQGI